MALAGARVTARQSPAAHLRVELESRRPEALDLDGTLHVAQLPPVEVPSRRSGHPAEEDVAGRLGEALAGDDPVPGVVEAALPEVRLQDRRGRLLDLQEQRVVLVAPAHQEDEAARPDAADAHDLARHVEDVETLDERPAVIGERPRLLPEEVLEVVDAIELLEMHDERGLLDDATHAVDDLGHLGGRLQAVAAARFVKPPGS